MLWLLSGLKHQPTGSTRANAVGIQGSDFGPCEVLDGGGCGFAFRGGFFAILVDVAKSADQVSEVRFKPTEGSDDGPRGGGSSGMGASFAAIRYTFFSAQKSLVGPDAVVQNRSESEGPNVGARSLFLRKNLFLARRELQTVDQTNDKQNSTPPNVSVQMK
jgi:hypothetical protein